MSTGNWFIGSTYVCIGTVQQTNVAAQNGGVKISFPAGTEGMLIRMSIWPNANFGAARTVRLVLLDIDGTNVGKLMEGSLTTTTDLIMGPGKKSIAADATANTVDALGSPDGGIWETLISGGEALQITGLSIAQNESIAYSGKFRVRGGVPTVAASSANFTKTSSAEKVI